MRRRREHQEVIGSIAEQFPQPVSLRFVVGVGGGHAVSFVHDYQLPVDLAESGKYVEAFG